MAEKLEASVDLIRKVEDEMKKEMHWKLDELREFQGKTFYGPDFAYWMRKRVPKRAPAGWITLETLAKKTGIDKRKLTEVAEKWAGDKENVGDFRSSSNSGVAAFYSPRLVETFKTQIGNLPPDDWKNATEIARKNKIDVQSVLNRAEELRERMPSEFARYSRLGVRAGLFYSPKFVEAIEEKIAGFAPEGWKTINQIQIENEISALDLKSVAEEIRQNRDAQWGEFRGRGGNRVYYSPTLQSEIVDTVLGIRQKKVFEKDEYEQFKLLTRSHEIEANEKIRDLEGECENFFESISSDRSVTSREFKQLLGIFGSAHSFDILYKYHPEFKGLEPEFVKGTLARYLGDFLILRSNFKVKDLEIALPFLSDRSFKDSLFEVVKESCLAHYHTKKLENREASDQEIIGEYISSLRGNEHAQDQNLAEVINRVEEYYSAILQSYAKPDQVMDQLKEGRPFPDLNQTLNIHEIAQKEQMLVGDEMGMGKSASAILSKEYLGVKLGLVVVPSNVLETWQTYLSDKREGDKQLGYFKEGQAPRVFVVEDAKSLEAINPADFDYILISQERMNKRYSERLKALGCDMLIIDEVHKFKNLQEGKRVQHVMSLAEQISEENNYLVLLSGTPVPNKIKDVALVLKLLYPDRFSKIKDDELVQSIIRGDIVDMRNLLLPRMQMKTLKESIEMPQLIEETLTTKLSAFEQDVYELLLEDDELTADQKIRAFRKFVMNPSSLEVTPEYTGSKVRDVGEKLKSVFADKQKAVMFVNGYVEGMIRGEDTMLEKLDLPPDVAVRIIDGSVPREERVKIKKEFKKSSEKILLVVSGQTADVGVDFSAAEQVLMYNDPWTEYDKRQQIARAYRPGLEGDLTVTTSIAEGTIEQGISEYIELKYNAIQKLLRGVPITDIEKDLLSKAEKQNTVDVEGDTALAKEWLNSPQNQLHRFFGITKEIGEKNFHKFLLEHGEEYAECYLDMGGRGFQANTGRLAGELISRFAQEKGVHPGKLKVLDVASGPEMLKTHIREEYQDSVVSLDINPFHFQKEGGNRVVGSFANLPIKEKGIDFLNMSLALHYSRFAPKRGEYERLKVFSEMNRALKVGGRAVINLIYSLDLKNKEKFNQIMREIGFKVIGTFSGEVSSGNNYRSQTIVLEKQKNAGELQELLTKLDRETLEGLKFKESETRSLKNSKRILDVFTLNGKKFFVTLNPEDQELLEEEEKILTDGNEMIEEYGSIKKIPKKEIIDRGFLRIFNGKQYRLLKKSEKIGGFVDVRS